jgi:hypothetical protein
MIEYANRRRVRKLGTFVSALALREVTAAVLHDHPLTGGGR